MNRKVHVVKRFNCLIATGGVLKVTGSHVYCKSGNISETIEDRGFDTTDH